MGVQFNTDSKLAKLFNLDAQGFVKTASDIAQSLKNSTKQINVKDDEPLIHESLAPSFGDISNAAESVKELDNKMKLMIAISMKQLLELKEQNKLDWKNIQGCFNQNTSLVADGNPVEIVKDFTSNSTADFKTDGSADPKIVQKIMTWWEGEACPDPDIRGDSKLDIGAMAKIVAESGAAIDNFVALFHKEVRHERRMLEVGVMRYPTIAKPHFTLYRIQLFAWSDCTRTLWHQEDTNGIKSSVTSQTFKPNDEVLGKVKAETTQKAASEIDDMFA